MAEMTVEAIATELDPATGGDVADFVVLMKPRVMFLVVFTALVGLVVAPGSMHPVLAIAALICIAAGAGAAGALNMWYDADIDAAMARTAARPIPRGQVTPVRGALLWCGSGLGLGGLSRADGELARVSAARLHHRLLCFRLHDVAQADHAAEHRHRRSCRRLAADDRLGRCDRNRKLSRLRPFPHHLLLDAATFLGARAS